MAEKPTTLPQWATDGGATLEPAAGVKGTGFVVGTRPPARWMNWILNTTYQWMQYLDTPVGTGSSAAITGTGGDSDGPGLKGVGGATNGVGIEGAGTGTGAGGYFYGATATGARGVLGYGSSGGTAGGDGGYFQGGTGSSTDGTGVIAEGQGTGVGIAATGVTGAAGTFDSANTTATVQATNSSTGYGIRGESAGGGILGVTNSANNGIYGSNVNASAGAGVRGEGYNGVVGVANSVSAAVYGTNLNGGSGVYGTSASGYGVEGSSINSFAVYGGSTASSGVRGASSTGEGVFGTSVDGTAVYGYSNNSYGGHFRSDASHALLAIGDQFSPVKSSFYMNQQDADPSSSDAGSIYLHGSAGQMSIKTNHNVWARLVNKLYAAVSDTDTVNQNGQFAQVFLLPGSTLRPGCTLRVRANVNLTSGTIAASALAVVRINMGDSFGANMDLGDARVSDLASNPVDSAVFDLDCIATIRSVGSSGIVLASGICNTSALLDQRPYSVFGMQCLSHVSQGTLNMTGNMTIRVNVSCGSAGTVFKLNQLLISTND